ncbi:hypothetical protein AAFC00_001385 [Neodothiora populina]|uniref:Snf7 family protein n=1 Tax=Neodothiora populina TaxID=2781224 RepID=A0ABR3PNS4_9PEZI
MRRQSTIPDLLEFLRTHDESFRSRTRLQSLYSDFRPQRETNPDNYAANSAAWMRALTIASRAGLLPLRTGKSAQADRAGARPSHLAFTTGDDLAASLQSPQFGRPPALNAVIRDAIEKKQLVPLDDFLKAKKSIYEKSAMPSPWAAIGWGFKKLGNLVGEGGDKLVIGGYIVIANVEEAAKVVARQISEQADASSLTSRIYSRSLFEAEFAHALGPAEDMALSSGDFTILTTYLTRDKTLLSVDADGETIKIKAPNETKPSAVTQQDKDIASLRTLITSMTAQVDSLNNRISALDKTVREAVSNKQTQAAKTALRSKKLASQTLEQRSATLAQLEEAYDSIGNAADQIAIVAAMQTSSRVLASLHEEIGGVEGVEGVVEGLREEIYNADEVTRIIDDCGAKQVDEDEVEEEFAELERVEREQVEAQEAEATRKRLEELGNAEAGARRNSKGKQREESWPLTGSLQAEESEESGRVLEPAT